MLLFSRQGKLRLQKWFLATAEREKRKLVRELMQLVLARKPKMCSFLEWRDLKVVYKRWGGARARGERPGRGWTLGWVWGQGGLDPLVWPRCVWFQSLQPHWLGPIGLAPLAWPHNLRSHWLDPIMSNPISLAP
uniref:AP complex mu/sigma subunit domain-containing protein n=1 Tax=Anas platyrhynchos platyrhynchos TaxID=8840 RepID=A0A493SSU3_ANAPP